MNIVKKMTNNKKNTANCRHYYICLTKLFTQGKYTYHFTML